MTSADFSVLSINDYSLPIRFAVPSLRCPLGHRSALQRNRSVISVRQTSFDQFPLYLLMSIFDGRLHDVLHYPLTQASYTTASLFTSPKTSYVFGFFQKLHYVHYSSVPIFAPKALLWSSPVYFSA